MTDARGVAAGQLLSFIQRWERLQEEKQAIAADQKEVLKEAASAGFDVPAIRRMIKERALDEQERKEREALDETYRQALGGYVDTELGKSAVARAATKARVTRETERRGDAVSPADLPRTEAGAAAKRIAEMVVEDGGTGFKITNARGETILEVRDDDPPPPKNAAGSIEALRRAMNAPSR